MIVQAKHWQTKSVAVPEVSTNVANMELMSPPVVRVLVFATSGAFTLDAVEWTERHNEKGTAPHVELWPYSKFEMLLAAHPALALDLDLDRSTLGPVVDSALRTSRDGVFAIGNLLHPVDTADVAAIDGRHVRGAVLNHLAGRRHTQEQALTLEAEAPLRWITPQLLRPGDPMPARGNLLLWTDAFRNFPTVGAIQQETVVDSRRLPWPAAPGRVFRVPAELLNGTDPRHGPVTIGLLD